MLCSVLRGAVVWRQITRVVEEGSPTTVIFRALINEYQSARPLYIPAYEIELLFDKLSLEKELHWKNFIDMSCYDMAIFDLKFHFLFDDDDEVDISLDELQTILSGSSIRIGSREYSPSVARSNIFPYLAPTKKFYWLLDFFQSKCSLEPDA